MRQIVFRVLALLLGVGALYFVFFTERSGAPSNAGIYRNVFFGCLLLAYGLGGETLLSKIPIIKNFVKTKTDAGSETSSSVPRNNRIERTKYKHLTLLSLGVVSLIGAASAVLLSTDDTTNSLYLYLSSALTIGLIYTWFHHDSSESNYDASRILRVGIVFVPVIALPYYFFSSRGLSGGFKAVAKTLVFCLFLVAIYLGGGLGTIVLGAKLGNANAQTTLGSIYVIRQDDTRAFECFQKAANQGSSDAQFNLGVMYSSGRGVSQNYTEALKWYREAAKQGNWSARRNIGLMYRHGRGVERDYAEALRWFENGCANCLAWLLATCPEDNIRDGRRAVLVAEELTAGDATAEHLDTLAAAYAEAERFQDAIRT